MGNSEQLGSSSWSTSRTRATVVALAVLAPLALWTVVELLIGLELRSPAFGDGEVADVGVANVLFAALVGATLALGLLALLERLTPRGPRIWLTLALAALVVSLGGPLGGTGIDADNRAVLAAMHVLVGGILIVGLYRSALAHRGDGQ